MKATSSGILVISTRLAITVPAVPPTTTPRTTQATPPNPPPPSPAPAGPPALRNSMMSARVVKTAMAMPTMPKVLPRREVVGCDRPFRAWMNSTDATRYSMTTTLRLTADLRGI
jgi:hypothetical protein